LAPALDLRRGADVGAPVVGGLLAHDGRVYVPAAGGSLSCYEEGEE